MPDLLIGVPQQPGENARRYAYRLLYENIMSLAFPPGMVLSDVELAQSLQVSRTPVREAIVSLQEAKLVEVYPQRSSCVSRLDLDAIEEGVFLRYHAECGIFRECVQKATGQDISGLHTNLLEQEKCLQSNNLRRYFALDNEFHKQLYLIAGRPWVWDTVTRIVTHHDRVRLLQVQLSSDSLLTTHQAHWDMFDAITSHSNHSMDDFIYNHLTAGYHADLPEMLRLYPDYFAI